MRVRLGLSLGLALLALGAAMAKAPAKDPASLDVNHADQTSTPWRSEFAFADQSVIDPQRVEAMDEDRTSADVDRAEVIAASITEASREPPPYEPPLASELLIHVGETLVPPAATDPNASDRFWRWLRDLLGVPDEDQRQNTVDGWFAGWPTLSRDDQRRLQQALAVLVLGITALVIVRELRASGWLTAGTTQSRPRRVLISDTPGIDGASDWRDAAPIERAPRFFNLVVAALCVRSAHSDAAALTNRERSQRFAAEAGALAPALADLARLADQSLYARRAADPEQLQRLITLFAPLVEAQRP